MNCKYCHADKNYLIKFGKQKSLQRYRCKNCGKTFVVSGNVKYERRTRSVVALLLNLLKNDFFDKNKLDEAIAISTDFNENQLNTVMSKRRPVCIAADGLSLLDDVGGIHGYCAMLRSIYEYRLADMGSVEERFRTTVWAKSMGWTGKMKALDKML